VKRNSTLDKGVRSVVEFKTKMEILQKIVEKIKNFLFILIGKGREPSGEG